LFVIGGIQKTSLLDFPGKIAAIVFTQGCNFRCGYCHNPDLLKIKQICHPELCKANRRGTSLVSLHPSGVSGSFSKNGFLTFLKTRIGKLDGVVITGGEPTIQSGLYDFIKRIKEMGFAVKLDTNGTNPEIVQKLSDENLLDYIAMDIKAPIDKYDFITNTKVNTNNIIKTINLVKNGKIDYEFRTTVLKSQLNIDDFEKIGELLTGAKKYYLQKFVPSEIYDSNLLNESTYTDEEFLNICKSLKKYIKEVNFR